jgi:DNA repair protein RecN (Recombination protein N)
MLAIKTMTATSRHGFSDTGKRPPGTAAPGLIFDEVDAGIGGRVADVVGRKLRALGSAFQVLCITHLPQIAAYADTHFQIEKRVDAGRTRASVLRLDRRGRVEEISRMLGGAGVTAGIRASAREMLERGVETPRPGESKGESERAKAKAAPGGERQSAPRTPR